MEDKSLQQGGRWIKATYGNERERKGREGKGEEAVPLTRKLNVNK